MDSEVLRTGVYPSGSLRLADHHLLGILTSQKLAEAKNQGSSLKPSALVYEHNSAFKSYFLGFYSK